MDNNQENGTQSTELNQNEQSSQLETCQEQLSQAKNKYIHLLADYDNFKKRQVKERTQWQRIAQLDVVMPLLPIIDNFDLALQQQKPQNASELTAWLSGFELIHKEFLKYLDKIGIAPIEVKPNDSFNPEIHESIMNTASETIETGNIVAVLQKGYTFNGQVIRPAKVSIAE